jgi:hypothetical protein
MGVRAVPLLLLLRRLTPHLTPGRGSDEQAQNPGTSQCREEKFLCRVCGALGTRGRNASPSKGQDGEWFCEEHAPDNCNAWMAWPQQTKQTENEKMNTNSTDRQKRLVLKFLEKWTENNRRIDDRDISTLDDATFLWNFGQFMMLASGIDLPDRMLLMCDPSPYFVQLCDALRFGLGPISSDSATNDTAHDDEVSDRAMACVTVLNSELRVMKDSNRRNKHIRDIIPRFIAMDGTYGTYFPAPLGK